MDGIGGKQMLIVLDNCEHLIEDVAPLTSNLLSACPRVKILTTSRESLRVPGEWLYTVPTLEFPKESSPVDMETASNFPALRLFLERARAVRSDYEQNAGNIQTVASICAQLDGLPLAIELIAARVRWMSPQEILKRLSDQFVLSACDFLSGSAAIAGGLNQPEYAAKLSGAAQTILETTDYRIPPFDHAEFDRHIQIARDRLGETRFEALATEGRAMTMEQAITYALENQSK